mmetsp:Transcript_31926/g.51117  ORF Transcript_31926/g.51117 Transcript_31926/m.51117 type:complete len:282 (-) Transcript_31926:198-1043(-)|eukprot:CAMPEP_0198678880 /NCGR_PEP_ID=MMETSP1468-20131203/1711_1 /TAXON_ID=1461545 /ORGANISM="Mantoniella sp, Strain CCMP1436" /LENGTH=281 /DNA_ID=CAMNT_0044416853 /DNA_START=16 /DNA_END=861 /DNA_ORIENTATION=+
MSALIFPTNSFCATLRPLAGHRRNKPLRRAATVCAQKKASTDAPRHRRHPHPDLIPRSSDGGEKVDVFVKKVGQHAVAALAALSLTASVGAIVAVAPASASSKAPTAYVAELIPTKGNAVTGRFTFTTVLNKSNQEVIEIAVDVKGLSPGLHGLNIHADAPQSALACDDGACTGVSFNPADVPHGAPDSVRKFGASACHFVGEGCVLWRHIGDLGNISADSSGAVSTVFKDPYVSLKKGKEANVVGRSVVLRAGPDDFVTARDDGNAGPIVAYGVLRPAAP